MTMFQLPEYLTVSEFQRWTSDHDQKINRILNGVERQQDTNIDHETRLITMEVNSTKAASDASKWSAGIATVVSTLALIFQHILGGKQ